MSQQPNPSYSQAAQGMAANAPTYTAEDPSNPLYLHHGENPGQILVNQPLTSQNYHQWSRAMYIALLAKNKLGFIDGSIPQPPTTDPSHGKWIRCNYMVLAWISNSLSSEIAGYTLYSESAYQVWKELKQRFSKSSNNRVYMLEQQLISTKQNGTPLSMYFSKLKAIWDEVNMYEETSVCSNDNCGIALVLNKRNETRRVMQFLMGLDETYAQVRNQVLLKDPLPQLDNVFNLVLQEEANLELSVQSAPILDSAAQDLCYCKQSISISADNAYSPL